MVATRTEAENIERFADKYRLCCSPVRLDIERDALGADYCHRLLRPESEFATAQADRRFAQAAIDDGLLRRSLITASRR